ncbi:MAG: hypothetical protein IT288_08060 [Bdellovibrionales bacterium]|nr:hypothetical protein [Bdellovibrionales bacterium]
MKKPEEELRSTLRKLEESGRKIVATRGYTREVEKIRMLEELIKEQLKNENTRYATRPVR